MDKRKMVVHGDVVLIEVNEIPKKATKVEDGIIARGEATGHHHKVLDGAIVMKGFDGELYVDVQDKLAKIIHQEHGDDVGDPVYRFKELPQGKYKVNIQRVYRYGEISKVQD